MQQQNIIDCYAKTAVQYAEKFINELSQKHFDRLILDAFAAENKEAGKTIDLGCGPGQTTAYLFNRGVTDILGVDISPEMISVAKQYHPKLAFETADMLQLPYADRSFAAAVAFYSIVHFDYPQVKTALAEIQRLLTTGGQFLFAFHTGENLVHLDNFLGREVNIDFYFFDLDKILKLVAEAGFSLVDVIERNHYEGIEYASKRSYIWLKK